MNCTLCTKDVGMFYLRGVCFDCLTRLVVEAEAARVKKRVVSSVHMHIMRTSVDVGNAVEVCWNNGKFWQIRYHQDIPSIGIDGVHNDLITYVRAEEKIKLIERLKNGD